MLNRIVPRPGKRAPWSIRFCALLALLAAATGSVRAAPTDYALIMPLASQSLLLDVAAAGDRLVAVGERGHILHSADQGRSWVQSRVPTSVMLTRLYFANDKLGWAVGHDGNVLVTEDGGLTWELQRDGLSDQVQINEDRNSRAIHNVEELRAQVEQAGDDELEPLAEQLEEAEYELRMAGEALTAPIHAPPLMDVWFANEDRGWASGAFGTLLHTTNGGRHWEAYGHKLDNPEELHLNGVTGDAGGTLYLASEWGYVFRSGSGGEHWELMETGYEGSFFGVLVNPGTGSVFAYGLLGTIYRSTDQGETWEELATTTRASLFGAVSTGEGALVFVGLNGTAVASRDDGETFFPLDEDTDRDLYGVASTGDGTLLAVGRGGSVTLSTAASLGR